MAVGSDQMVDLELLQDGTNERPAARATGIGFLERSERAKNIDEGSVWARNGGDTSQP